MKKQFSRILMVAATCIALSAGTTMAQNGRFSLGAEVSLPMGDFGDASGIGFGGTLRYEMPMGDNLGLTGTAGYLTFTEKETGSGTWSMIPVQIGAKYYFSENQEGLYGHVMLGIHSISYKTPTYDLFGVTYGGESVSETDLSYAPEIGYHMANIDIGVRYQMVATSGSTTSYLGARIAYVFGEK